MGESVRVSLDLVPTGHVGPEVNSGPPSCASRPDEPRTACSSVETLQGSRSGAAVETGVAVRDSDGYLLRLGYEVTLAGTLSERPIEPEPVIR